VRARPNECWQVDDTHYLMGLGRGQEVRIINFLDDNSRLVPASVAVLNCTSDRVWEAFCLGVNDYGVPAEVLNDNGRAYISAEGHKPTLFHAHLGVHQIHSRPYHPQTCGKVERFHQTQGRWLAAQPQARLIGELQDLLDRFRHLYNHERRHRGIARRTPIDVWSAQPPATPATTPASDTTEIIKRRVDPIGTVRVNRALSIGVGIDWAAQPVTIIRRGDHATIVVTGTGEVVRHLTIDPTRYYQPSGKPRGRRSRTNDNL
jgi:hypothetical protein